MSWSALLRDVVLPLGDRASNQTVMRHFRFYAESMRWPVERIRAEQDRRLREVVQEAYTAFPFYRDLYDRAGVAPSSFRGREDLRFLPMVDKAMLRAAYPGDVTRRTRYPSREYSTGGSTGQPFTVLIDNDTMSRARALMLLRTVLAGWDFGAPIFQTGMAVERGLLKSFKDRLLRVTYRSAFDLSPQRLDEYLDTIAKGRIRFVSGYAQSLHLLAERAVERDRQIRLDGAVTWGTNLLAQFRQSIGQAFGCEVYDSYGVGEGMQIAAQSRHSGPLLHQFCLHTTAEIVAGGEPVPPGNPGEVVLTRLDVGAMPLIRYRVGDVARAAPDGGSPGGINLPLWSSIDGRVSDIVRTPSGNQLIAEFFFGIMQYYTCVRNFQVVQTTRSRLQVRIVPSPGFGAADWERIAADIRAKGDPALELDLELVDEIPLEPSNKRRYIISRVEQA